MSRRVGLESGAGMRNPVAVGVAGVTCRSTEAENGVLLGVRAGVGVAVLVAVGVAVALTDSAGSPQADGVAVAVAVAAVDGLGDGVGDGGAMGVGVAILAVMVRSVLRTRATSAVGRLRVLVDLAGSPQMAL
jgi:hypothetical protein